jgi:uncharacterized surface protein with fasciclin (FAS1) repeats
MRDDGAAPLGRARRRPATRRAEAHPAGGRPAYLAMFVHLRPRRVFMSRRLIGTLAVAGAAVCPIVAAAGPATAAAPSARGAQSKTIVGVAAGDPQFSTLVKLVKSAGLAGTLSKGSYTVFAPTNAAFAKVPKPTLDALAKDKAMLKSVLTYHVVKGRVPASKVVGLKSAKTVNGATVKIAVKGGKVYLNGSTRVTKTDIAASNGIVHVIDKVLLPPS